MCPFPRPCTWVRLATSTQQLVIHVLVRGHHVLFLPALSHSPGGSRIDLFYRILSAVSIATLLATALSFLTLRTDQGLTRGLIIYHWALSAVLVTLGRVLTGGWPRLCGAGIPERLLLVGTGDIARMILQKTLQSRLGYRVVGFVGRTRRASGCGRSAGPGHAERAGDASFASTMPTRSSSRWPRPRTTS